MLIARRLWSRAFKVLGESNFQPGTFYPAKMSIKWEDRLRAFSILSWTLT